MAINITTKQRVAVKIMKSNTKPQDNVVDSFLNEVGILINFQHTRIVKIRDFEINGIYKKKNGKTKKILYYVMSLAENGELYRLIEQTDAFHEKLARFYFRQLIQAIQFLHKNGIAHRDIKTQNIVIDKNFKLKLVDFGFSCSYLDKDFNKINMNSDAIVGSPQFHAPEIVNTNQYIYYHGDEIDIFASGCVLFYMIMKSAPFKTANFKDEYYRKLIIEDKSDYWNIFSGNIKPSKEFKDLIQKLLHHDSNKRIKLNQIKKHPWYKGEVLSQAQFNKQMQLKLKKLGNILKIERDTEIKSKILKYKNKESYKIYQKSAAHSINYQVSLRNNQRLLKLKSLLKQQEISDGSSSDNKQKCANEQKFQ